MATKRNLRSRRHKRRVTKKHRVHRRTKKYLKKNMSKRRRYSKRVYQRGGLFNDNETAQLKDALKRIGFTDENEINNIITDMGKMSQQFSGKDFGQILYQMEPIKSPEEFREWIADTQPFFEEIVETDVEDNSDDDDV